MNSDDSSSDDDDYEEFGPSAALGRRYPIHDACEFESVERLRHLIFVPEEDDDDDDHAAAAVPATAARLRPGHHHHEQHNAGSSSSSSDEDDDDGDDENDSTQAAHAAATGHSPEPMPRRTSGANPLEGPTPPTLGKIGSPAEDSPTAATTLTPANAASEAKTPTVSNATATALGAEAGPPLPNVTAVGNAAGIDNAKPKLQTKQKEGSTDMMDVDESSTRDTGTGTPEPAIAQSESLESTDSKTNGAAETAAAAISAKLPPRKEHHFRPVPTSILNERDEDENTAMHIAIHSRKLEHLKLLLEAGASFRLKCDGSFPLHTAVSMGALKKHRQFAYEAVVALHEAGADVTIKDDSNHTPLYLACMFNLSELVSYILSDDEGLATLNVRADRTGNRPLHAAAKYDTKENASFSRSAAATVRGHIRSPTLTEDTTTMGINTAFVSGKLEASRAAASGAAMELNNAGTGTAITSNEALSTQILLGTNGIEVDGLNALNQTPLHIACVRGNWPVARLLLQAGASPTLADRRGYTPGQWAHKRGIPIPNDLQDVLGGPPEAGNIPPPRDLLVDPDGATMVLTHELCLVHRTCPPIRRDAPEPPPENVRRLIVLVDDDTGILRSGEFGRCIWKVAARRAAMADILKVHDYRYVETISALASSVPDIPNAVTHLDPDTALSRWSFEAALRAAGSVCEAVDHVVTGEYRNAFCAVRPPGHHAGPRGIVRCANDPEGGSHGFCLLNNVAIGAAYARSMYRNEGIKKVAIIDFDVHHGNGTEEIVRQLVPTTERAMIRVPFVQGEISSSTYRPWLDEADIENVFFASTHGYGNRGDEQPGVFYPASGKTNTSEAILHPGMLENPNLSDFILSQTWARMGDDAKSNCCKIINVGFALPDMHDADLQGRNMKQRLDLRDSYRTSVLPHLREFDPDLIFISAGFDAHRRDTMNFGYVGMVEEDYEWVTEQLVKVANTCCNGRIVAVLEGGYKIHGGIVSPFARSVASHVRALVDGGRSRELYDAADVEWESQYERHVYERRERKKEEERERLRVTQEATRATLLEAAGAAGDDIDGQPARKRRRNQVDYKELFKQMQQEGFT